MQVHHPIGGDFGVLVRFIADDPLAAYNIEIGAEFPWAGDLVLSAELKAEAGDPSEMIAGNHKNITVGVGKRIERRLQRQRTLKRCIDVGVVCINVPTIPFVGCAGLNAFAQRVAGVLKELMSRDWAGHVYDVISIERAKSAYGPVQLSFGDLEVTA